MKPSQPSQLSDSKMAHSIISLVGDKWSVLIVVSLGKGKRRFSEIKQVVEGVSQKVLTDKLRGLERDGYVMRMVYPTIPPKVEYGLTDFGRELLIPIQALASWAIANYPRVQAARAVYDTRGTPGAAE